MNDARYQEYLSTIEDYLQQQCFVDFSLPQAELFRSMRYSLLAGGKRLRPVFVFDFCRMCGGQWQDAVPFAAAIEMIHTYSLIHDDLPCMDNDDLRRGKPTNHKVFGEAMAVLAGDALLTAAFSTISNADLSAQIRIKAVQVLAECAGELGMVGGQVLDIKSDERQCSAQEVHDIQSRKTGALFRAACQLGVLAGNGTETQLAAAADFAQAFGLAFQIRDDMLDVIGNANELGKQVGTDLTKNTFVQLYGLGACKTLVDEHTAAAVRALNGFADNDFMKDLSSGLVGRTV